MDRLRLLVTTCSELCLTAPSKVRKQFELASKFVTQLSVGTRMHVIETRVTTEGVQRVCIVVEGQDKPRGWVTMRQTRLGHMLIRPVREHGAGSGKSGARGERSSPLDPSALTQLVYEMKASPTRRRPHSAGATSASPSAPGSAPGSTSTPPPHSPTLGVDLSWSPAVQSSRDGTAHEGQLLPYPMSPDEMMWPKVKGAFDSTLPCSFLPL